MAKIGYTPEQIISKLREADALLSQGAKLSIVLEKIGVGDVTYYQWRRKYDGVRVDQAHRLKHLEQEHSRLKKLRLSFSLNNDACILIEQWRQEYNQVCPHSSLGYRLPAPEAILTRVTTKRWHLERG